MTCVDFPQPSKLTLCVAGLCALDSAPEVHSGSRACVRLFQLPGLVSAPWGSVNLFWLPVPILCVTGFMSTCLHSLPALCGGDYLFHQLCQEGCVHCPSLYASALSAPQSCSLHPVCFHFLIFKKCVLLSSGCLFHLIITFGVSHYHCLSLFNLGIQTCFHVLTTNSLFLSKTNIQNICFDKRKRRFKLPLKLHPVWHMARKYFSWNCTLKIPMLHY